MDSLKIVKTNLHEMLTDRRYKSFDKNDEGNYLIYKKPDNKKLVIFFILEHEKVGVDYVKNIIIKSEDMKIEHLMIISRDKLTPFANRHIQQSPLKIEFFLFEELMFNITKHHLVSKHILLLLNESQEVIEYYGKKNLPQIKHKDPISRYYDAEIGNIFRIYRNEGGIYYRLVV